MIQQANEGIPPYLKEFNTKGIINAERDLLGGLIQLFGMLEKRIIPHQQAIEDMAVLSAATMSEDQFQVRIK